MPFAETCADHAFKENIRKCDYPFEEVDIGGITFQEGQTESIHRWYRLTPSFSPSLVRHFLGSLHISSRSVVLDPFCGRGTTIIECQKHGVPSLGFEINPLLQTVADFSLRWNRPSEKLFLVFRSRMLGQIAAEKNKTIEEVLERRGMVLPNIHNVYRWWRPAVLKDLLIARQLLAAEDFQPIRPYLWLALNTAALECANIHRNHPTITFDDDHQREIDACAEIEQRIQRIVHDLKHLSDMERGQSGLGRVVLHNACEPFRIVAGKKITHVITSPPYPNRFSYIHQTRPQLHFMELLGERSEATEIDLKTIGGTWGRATSNLARRFIAPPTALKKMLHYVDQLKGKNLLMCNYATKYFMDLDIHIRHLRRIVARGFRGAYVVGNSRLAGVEIFTETILAQLFEENGFTVERIVLFRKRGGKKRLYETAVCVQLADEND